MKNLQSFFFACVEVLALSWICPVEAGTAQSQFDKRETAVDKEVTPPKALSIGILLYPGWEPLDVFGPYQLISSLSGGNNWTVSFIASKTGPITSIPPPFRFDPSGPLLNATALNMVAANIVATHTFATAPLLDIILSPGGMGLLALDQNKDTSLEDFVRSRAKKTKYIISVCNGVATLAKAGVLKGKKATGTKSLWAWTTSFGGDKITWVPSARWVVDGKVWTSSGVTSGLDMMIAFTTQLLGAEVVNPVVNGIEHAPHTDPHWDPFSVVFKVADVKAGRHTTRSGSDEGKKEIPYLGFAL